MFFVEVVYDSVNIQMPEVRCFKEAHRLDKYSLGFKTEY